MLSLLGFGFDIGNQSWKWTPLFLYWWRRVFLALEKLLVVIPLSSYKILRDGNCVTSGVRKEILSYWVLQFNIMVKITPDDLAGDFQAAVEKLLINRNHLFQLVKFIYYSECVLDNDWTYFILFCKNCPRQHLILLLKTYCVLRLPAKVQRALSEARIRESSDGIYLIDQSLIPAL